MSTDTAALWNLDVTDEEVVRESIGYRPDIPSAGERETVFTPDRRERVNEIHFAPDGKYRGVLKIHTKFASQNDSGFWTTGTGWLLRNDVVVTAAHAVLESQQNRAVSLKAYAGYHGLGSIGKDHVQTRRGKRVVLSKAYYDDQNHHHRDVALVKLEKPFESIQPFTYCDTPERGNSSLGVVGYPADKGKNSDESDLGPFMYEEFADTSWNLHETQSHLLQYPISTFGGQSGAPVICAVNFQCIGTHILGVDKSDLNSASPIGGKYGNPYKALVEAIAKAPPLQKASNGVWTKPLSLSESVLPAKGNRKGPQQSRSGPTMQLRRKENVYGTLGQYDTLFLVDDSDSMMEDGTDIDNKWEITKKLIAEIAPIAVKYDKDGVEVKFINFRPKPEKRKALKCTEDVMRLFKDLEPCGESLIATALERVLSEYCYQFKHDRAIKSLNLIVLTDGDPSPGEDVEKVIVDCARTLRKLEAHPLQVGIQFVQIGDNSGAAAYLNLLDDKLKEKHKLDRDMVDTVLYDENSSEPLHEKILLGGILKRLDNASI